MLRAAHELILVLRRDALPWNLLSGPWRYLLLMSVAILSHVHSRHIIGGCCAVRDLRISVTSTLGLSLSLSLLLLVLLLLPSVHVGMAETTGLVAVVVLRVRLLVRHGGRVVSVHL